MTDPEDALYNAVNLVIDWRNADVVELQFLFTPQAARALVVHKDSCTAITSRDGEVWIKRIPLVNDLFNLGMGDLE